MVSRKETALSELIKNAYDADASTVEVRFERQPGRTAALVVSDDGSGMRRSDIVANFMRVSTVAKERQPFSPKKKRARAGRKGIGRFAAQRLARELSLETETAEGRYRLTIDWERFHERQELADIPVALESLAKTGKSGTTLRLVGLRDEWSDRDIEIAYVYAAELLEPERSGGTFVVRILRDDGKEIRPIIDDPTPFRKFSAAEVSGEIRGDHKGYWSVQAPRLGITSRDNVLREPKNKRSIRLFSHLPPLRFSALYFIKTPELIPGPARKQVREYLALHGGIRLYRNGFRVLPYGERGDDWLNLDQLSRTRVLLVPVSNDNWLGAVTINDMDGRYFQETSSREGIIHNDSFAELREYLTASLMAAVLLINERRGVKTLASQPARAREPSAAQEVRALKNELRTLANPNAYRAAFARHANTAKAAAQRVGRIERTYASLTRRLIQENALLRILASIGLTVGEFTHEVRYLLATIKAGVGTLKKVRRVTDIAPTYERLAKAISGLSGYVGYFDRLTSANYSREQRPIDLINVVYEFRSSARPVLARSDIALDVRIEAKSATSVPMHESEWSSVLLNFMTNSIKAIDRGRRTGGRILVRVSLPREDTVRLDFEDNGAGIPAGDKMRVFDAFYTTSAFDPNADEVGQSLGTGLGLKIVRDIIGSAGGTVAVVDASPGYTTCMRVEVPANV